MTDTNLKEKRIKDASAARTLWGRFRTASKPRREKWAQVQNQLDGAPPFANSELVKSGQGWRCNINFRDASSTLEHLLVSYWRLLHDTTNLAAVSIRGSDPNSERYEAIFQENFNSFVEDWGADYVRNYLLFSQNHVSFGVGTVFYPDSKTPRWEVVRVGEIEVPAKAKASVEKLTVVGIRQEMEIDDLWDLIRTPEKRTAAKARGWNVTEIDKVLTHEVRQLEGMSRSATPEDVMEMQREMRNNSLGVSTGCDPLSLVHLFIKEFDGKISRRIFCENKEHNDEFLFDDSDSSGRPTSMLHVLSCVFFDAGNGDFWGTKGFGVKNFQISTVQNRLKSRAVDRTMIDGLTFRDLSDGARETVPITNVGPFNFLPKDVEQVPHYPTGRTILETIAMLDDQSAHNNARYRNQSNQIANTDTATQANILANLASEVDVANATLYLRQIARNIFTEQLRRLRLRGSNDPDAKVFRKRCIEEAGMPEAIFYDAELSVRTGADPGAANIMLQAQYATEALSLPSANRRYFEEKIVSARFGAQAVKKGLLPLDATSEIRSVRLALMENSDMGEGSPLPVDPQDNHAAHLPAHLQPLQVIIDRFDQSGQVNPDALIALQNAIPHTEEHFQYLKEDKLQEALYRQLWPQYTAIRSAAEGIFRMVEKMQAQAQGAPPGGMNPAGMVGAGAPQ